jgi:hypothetical protein
VLHHKRVKAERAETERYRARLTRARAEADAIWTSLATAASNIAGRVDNAKAWAPDADIAATAILALTNKLTDAALMAEAETNTVALAQIVNQAATGTLHDMMIELRGVTNAAGTNRVVILATTNAAVAEQTLAVLTNLPTRAEAIEQTMAAEIVKAGQAHKALLALKKRVADAAAEQQAAAEQAAKEKAEAERKAQAEAEAQRQAEAKERENEAEKDRVLGVRKANSGLIQQNQFKQAEEALTAIEKDLKTEAGKEAYKQATARYRLLSDLKAFIIAGIAAEVKANPATGYKFGWQNAKDILGADEAKVTVRGGAVPWEQVPPAQVIRFVKHYAADPGLSKREAAQQNLAAAVYVFEAGGGSEAAQKMAAEFAGEATRASAAIEAQVKALLPELSGGK